MTESPSAGPVASSRDQASGRVALLIIDMINGLDFPGGDRIAERARQAASAILTLREECDIRGIPVVYVNDNFGEWHSEKSKLIERARQADPSLVDLLAPRSEDFFIIKPQFSGFYSTNLAVLLPKLGVSRLIMTGIATDICILFTAADAHMRDYDLWVPSDCVASECADRQRSALNIMEASMSAETAASTSATFEAWTASHRPEPLILCNEVSDALSSL